MSDFGGKLRQARERRGVSLRQIAASTKISVAALEALERNDVSKLPGGIFSRAFVRSYAIEVGLNPEETVREFLERFHGEPTPTAAAAPRVTEEESSFESQQRMAGVLLKLVIISIPLVGVILYFTLRQRPAPEPAAETRPPQAAQVAPTGSASVPVPTLPADVALRPSETLPAAQPGPMRLELRPTGPCWVTLTVDGRQVFSRIMQPGERVVYEVREAAVIDVGDAGAFAFSVDGRPGRVLGETGQVRTARITRATLADYIR
jgi:cytoskeleton protein RodZ